MSHAHGRGLHHHPHAGSHDHVHDHGDHSRQRPGSGHNGPRPATQWQTLHEAPPRTSTPHEHDLDLVEASFVESFDQASDVTSFLRLAGIPFVGCDESGRQLRLLRVEIENITDVAALTPLLAGAGHRYDPLPARFTSRRRKLSFSYFDGQAVVALDFTAARKLRDQTPP